jgi:hypothetical protein
MTKEDQSANPSVGRLQNLLLAAAASGENVGIVLVHAAAVERTDTQHGFNAGDRLSNRIRDLLQSKLLRRGDSLEILARDLYACILTPVSSPGVTMLAAHRIMALLGTTPLEPGGKAELADIAIGISMFPEHGPDAENLLRLAKQATQTARNQRDHICMYEVPAAVSTMDPSHYADRLRTALDLNNLAVHFMPQIGLRTGRLTGAEALLRWNDEILGVVPPYAAVQTAESTGQIDRLTQWVITSAVQHCAEFQSIEPGFSVSVNVSPSNLREPDLPLYIDRALRTWDVDSGNLTVEITESAMMHDANAATSALRELKSLGVRLSIDDFGTGYSSMYYLAQLPLDELKIDLSFVRTMLEVPVNAKIVRSLVELAHNLELSVVAEGVESEAIMSSLAHLHCDQAQGYHVGKAVPAEDLATRLRKQKT